VPATVESDSGTSDPSVVAESDSGSSADGSAASLSQEEAVLVEGAENSASHPALDSGEAAELPSDGAST
jgi:hypothetical protein